MKYLIVFLAALQFLTRVPLRLPVLNGIAAGEILPKSISCFPLVGLLMGIVAWAIFEAGNYFFNPWTVAAIILAAQLVLTGGLHIDGFMDTCDALFSNKSRQQMLEIMKDSRVGALGAASAMVLLLLKYSLLAQIPAGDSLTILIAMLVLSRWSLTAVIVFFPYAREAGFGKTFQDRHGRKNFLIASLITLFILVPLQEPYLFFVWVVIFIFSMLLSKRISNLLGGLTGDNYGYLSEINEIACMFLLILFFS